MAFDKTQPAYIDFRATLAERSDSIVAWTGAGLSMPARLPSWEQMKTLMIQELSENAERERDPERRKEIEGCCTVARHEENYWKVFSLLQRQLGNESYKAAIRRVFRDAEHVSVPEAYRSLWRLGLSGMITLNIDQFATEAFGEVRTSALLNDFTGKNIRDYVHVLRSNRPWLANLHGILPEASSWVFTASELSSLLKDPGYDQFIKACFASRTVVFLGMSAEDVAAGEHLAKLTRSGVDCGGHYWITHSSAKRDWAERSGIRLIIYDVKGEDHTELLDIFEDLMSYQSPESEAGPVVSTRRPPTVVNLPPPEELEVLPANEIRDILNGYASRLLAETNEATVKEFEAFAEEYAEAIYRAWFVGTKPPKNQLLGLDISEECKDGAFGTVYRASDRCGKQYAVKVLHEKVRKNREMLQSFRRGVNSMRILTSQGVDGVVGYHDASEIPAVVVMDFIEGMDLAEATKKSVLANWNDLIKTCLQLTEILRHSHRLPQRVLHRDIRPSNIMLENCWGPNPDWSNVKLWVLDFDLSHHLDSFDVSVSQPGQANGYLAPEQVERTKGVSTRSATVDSFGLGMTFYYLRTGKEPRFAEHRYQDWPESLEGCARNYPCPEWTSLPKRFARLILHATKERQSDRLDVSGIENELFRLNEVIVNPGGISSAELLAEELASRVFGYEYGWNVENLSGMCKLGNILLRLQGDEAARLVHFECSWMVDGMFHHQDVRRWLPTARDKMNSALRKGGWEGQVSVNTGTLQGSARIGVPAVTRDFETVVRSLVSAKEALRFD